MEHEISMDCNPLMTGMAEILSDIEYSEKYGLGLTLILPWNRKGLKLPLVVFVQGCSFNFPNVLFQIPQLSQLARTGVAVATITHRSAQEGCAFPAYLKDVKTAIRFLRANAAEYSINPEKVGIWGTSSGGNAALLAGLTADDPAYRTSEYRNQSDSVSYVIDCFGPTHFPSMTESLKNADWARELMEHLIGENDPEQIMKDMSPLCHVVSGRQYPDFLLLHGDNDSVVPFAQSTMMHEALLKSGYSSTLICIKGGSHEGNFWSGQVLDYIYEFIKEHCR